MKKDRFDIITCPFCGAEYTAGELFIPKYFLGVPKDLERDSITKKIISDFGTSMNTKEKYICDYCNTPFKIRAVVKFIVEEDVQNNFNREYTTKLNKSKNYLSED